MNKLNTQNKYYFICSITLFKYYNSYFLTFCNLEILLLHLMLKLNTWEDIYTYYKSITIIYLFNYHTNPNYSSKPITHYFTNHIYQKKLLWNGLGFLQIGSILWSNNIMPLINYCFIHFAPFWWSPTWTFLDNSAWSMLPLFLNGVKKKKQDNVIHFQNHQDQMKMNHSHHQNLH